MWNADESYPHSIFLAIQFCQIGPLCMCHNSSLLYGKKLLCLASKIYFVMQESKDASVVLKMKLSVQLEFKE